MVQQRYLYLCMEQKIQYNFLLLRRDDSVVNILELDRANRGDVDVPLICRYHNSLDRYEPIPYICIWKKFNVTRLHLYTFWRQNKFNVMREKKCRLKTINVTKKTKYQYHQKKTRISYVTKNSIMLLVGRQTV